MGDTYSLGSNIIVILQSLLKKINEYKKVINKDDGVMEHK